MKKKITTMQLGEGLEEGKTDWESLKNMRDEDIDCSDIPELDDAFWKNAKLVIPPHKQQLTIRLDSDILGWLKGQGQGYQTRINSILRSYYEAHKNNAPGPEN